MHTLTCVDHDDRLGNSLQCRRVSAIVSIAGGNNFAAHVVTRGREGVSVT